MFTLAVQNTAIHLDALSHRWLVHLESLVVTWRGGSQSDDSYERQINWGFTMHRMSFFCNLFSLLLLLKSIGACFHLLIFINYPLTWTDIVAPWTDIRLKKLPQAFTQLTTQQPNRIILSTFKHTAFITETTLYVMYRRCNYRTCHIRYKLRHHIRHTALSVVIGSAPCT